MIGTPRFLRGVLFDGMRLSKKEGMLTSKKPAVVSEPCGLKNAVGARSFFKYNFFTFSLQLSA